MSGRADRLRCGADAQIVELIELVGPTDRDLLRRPAPGREKLGDGTLGALAQHTADNYRRIADFALTGSGDGHGGRISHRIRRLLRVSGHRPPRAHGPGSHAHSYVGDEVDPEVLGRSLGAIRERFADLALVDDSRLDGVPVGGSFRFCDGTRTLEEIISALLDHQRHQLGAIRTAIDDA